MEYLLFGLLLCSSAFFSSSETSFFSLSSLTLSQFRESKETTKQIIAKLRAHPHDFLITVLLGNELTNIAISIVSASILHDLFVHFQLQLTMVEQALLSSAILVPILLVFGEITPKSVASLIYQDLVMYLARPLQFFAWITRPIRWVLHIVAQFFLYLLGGQHKEEQKLDEEGFRALVKASERDHVISSQERKLICNVLDFGDKTVAQMMTPWSKVSCIDYHSTIDQVIECIKNKQHSRLPVLDGNQVKGMIYAKDLLAHRWGIETLENWQKNHIRSLSSLASIPPTMLASKLLEKFKQDKVHLAIIRDEQQQLLGICTLDDLLINVFGPIKDETVEGSGDQNV
jgi:putative hemolysin